MLKTVTDIEMELFRRIRDRMNELGINGTQLGDRVDLDSYQISRKLCGSQTMFIGDFVKICKALKTSPNAMLGMTEPFARDPNPYWERVNCIAAIQRNKGIRTYGKGIESNTASIDKRLTMMEEELVDALMYLEWVREAVGGNAQ